MERLGKVNRLRCQGDGGEAGLEQGVSLPEQGICRERG